LPAVPKQIYMYPRLAESPGQLRLVHEENWKKIGQLHNELILYKGQNKVVRYYLSACLKMPGMLKRAKTTHQGGIAAYQAVSFRKKH